MNIDQEIKRGIVNFVNKYNIKIDQNLIDQFIKENHKRRRISLTEDTFLLMCEYLCPFEIIMMATLCKEFMAYYPKIWCVIQQRQFPNSLIPKSNYILIRNQMAIDHWHCEVNSYDYKSITEWTVMESDDKTIKKRSSCLTELTPSHVGYTWKKNVNTAEIRSISKDRKSTFDECSAELRTFIDKFKFVSDRDYTGNQYYIIKPDIDMRLYGLNPENKEDEKKWAGVIKWVTYEYNEFDRDYTYVRSDPIDESIYEYVLDESGNTYSRRIRPDWLS